MKRIALLFSIVIGLSSFTTLHTDHYTVDKKKSKIAWTGSKLAEKHTGGIFLKEGTFSINHGKIVKANFTMDMNTITCSDIENKEWNEKLVSHLKNEDFFDVEKHPTSSFQLVRATQISDFGYEVLGTLTIKGITKPITTKIEIHQKDDFKIVVGELIFDRTNYDIKYGSGKFYEDLGDRMIHDKVSIQFELLAQ